MVVIIVTNARMGISCMETKGTFAPNYRQILSFSCGISISQRPIFGVALRTKKVKQNWVFCSRKRYFGAINVSLKGDSGTGLVDGGIFEKELQFKPSFDEYLKAMESLRSGREKNQAHHSNGYKLRNDSRGKGIPARPSLGGDDKNVKLGDSEEHSRPEKSKLSGRDKIGKNSNGTSFREGLASSKVDYRGRISRGLKGSRNKGFEEKNNAGSTRGLVQDDKQSKVDVNIRGKLEMATNNSRWTGNKTDSVQESQTNDELERSDIDKHDFVSTKMTRRLQKDHIQGDKVPDKKIVLKNQLFPEYSSDNELEMERAAFKPLEEYRDVYDKPRVSRVDMEERIQKLAKCLNGADINMPEWMFSKMMRSANIRFSDHSMLRIIQILGNLGNWRRVLQVIEWIQSCERFKSHKIRYIYTAALSALGKARRPVEALNMFYAMQQHMSSYPDLVAYRSIAVTLGQAGHMKELFDVIDSMRSPPKKKFKTGVLEKWDPRLEPDIVIYNAVLNACVHRKKWEGAFWVLQQLKQQDQQPSSTTYGLIMEVMFASGKYNLVHDVFRKVQKSSIPNALTYKVLLNTLWREGKTDEAMMAVQDMERRGIVGSAGLYYDLARCLCSAGRCQEALMQIDKICKVATKPLVVTYTGLIQACLDSGNIENGSYIFNHMHKFCSPNLVTCNIMLKAYLDHGMFEEAKELFQRLSENCNHSNSKSGYKDKAIPDIYTFNLMLDACFVKQRWDDLEFVYKMMLQYGYHFNAKRHLQMIMDASRAGKGELLETTWKHLVQANRVPPPLLIKEIFRMQLEEHDYAAAISCITDHPLVDSQVFSRKAWLKFFMENANRFQKDTLVRLVDEITILASRRLNPVVKDLLTSCIEFLRTQVTVAEIDRTETDSRLECETALLL